MSISSGPRDVPRVSERLQFRYQFNLSVVSILCQPVKLFRRKRVLMEQEVGNRGKTYCATLVVCKAELERIEFPVRTKVYDALVVFKGFRDAPGIDHKAAQHSVPR